MKNIRTPRQLLARVCIRPLFPVGQLVVMSLGIVKGPKTVDEAGKKRQFYLIGHLRSGVSVEEVVLLAKENGFFKHRIAFNDPGQSISMRRLDDEDPKFQYHLRVFSDGEVRGHYEFTPEDNFIGHMRERVLEARHEQFMEWFGSLLTVGSE